jgi:non-specific serine/threonine protein kinase
LGLRLAGALWLFWAMRGHLSEGRAWLERAIARGGQAPAGLRAQALFAQGLLSWSMGDYPAAAALGEKGLALAEQAGDPLRVARIRFLLGRVAAARGDAAAARAQFAASEERYRAIDDRSGVAACLRELGGIAAATGDPGLAERLATQALELSRAIGFEGGTALALYDLGRLALTGRDATMASSRLRESLTIMARRTERWYLILPLAGLAQIAGEGGDLERAARLAGAVAALGEHVAPAIWQSAQPQVERTAALARAGLGAERFAATWREGQALPIEAAVIEAGQVAPSSPVAAQPSTDHHDAAARHGLTPREIEVLRLLVEGRPDREIAEALSISHHTVMRHVGHILAKLGAESRTAAASQAVRAGLV